MSRALSLALLLAAPAALAAEEGFGGAPAADEAPLEREDEPGAIGDECLIQDEEGRWRSCAEVLERKAPAKPEPPPEERPPLTLPAPPDDGQPKYRKIDETRAPVGAFGKAIAGAQAAAEQEFPLLKLREKVAALGAEAKALEEDPVRFRQAEQKHEEHRFWVSVQQHVEDVGFRQMRSCIANEMPEWKEVYQSPSLYRMTPGGPVLVPEEERRQLPPFDPPGCERIRLVDDATIEKVRRLHEVRARLDSRELGFFQRDEKVKLLEEAKALEQQLGEGGPTPLPKLFAE